MTPNQSTSPPSAGVVVEGSSLTSGLWSSPPVVGLTIGPEDTALFTVRFTRYGEPLVGQIFLVDTRGEDALNFDATEQGLDTTRNFFDRRDSDGQFVPLEVQGPPHDASAVIMLP